MLVINRRWLEGQTRILLCIQNADLVPQWSDVPERGAIPEIRGSGSFMDLRTREQLKIRCGKRHFEALENEIELRVATDWKEFRAGSANGIPRSKCRIIMCKELIVRYYLDEIYRLYSVRE